MKTYLLTRPEHDDTTYVLSSWCKSSIDFAKSHGFNVVDISKEKVTKKEVEGRLKKSNPNLVVFIGHGNESSIAGDKRAPIIVVGENEKLLKNKIIYSISCKSAKILGQKSIDSGAISYAGYVDDFIFVYTKNKLSRILSDNVAELFLEPSKNYIESLLKGNTIEDAAIKYRQNLHTNFLKSLGEGYEDEPRFLWWDLKNFVVHGNKKVSLNDI